jgi:hypothetical protein
MERIVVVSTNNNSDYFFYSPYIKKAWNKYGWKVCTMVTDDVPLSEIHSDYTITVPKIEGIRQETIAQASRLYAANHFSGDYYLMVSDMDLLPLSDYWKPELDKITSWGHDLTDYSFYPMGYIGMPVDKWRSVMRLTGDTVKDFERDAKELGTPYKADWETWWNYDWDLLTKRLKSNPMFNDIVNIKRGRQPGSCYAVGRVDRGLGMAIPEGQLIDAHCDNINVKHEDKLPRFLNLFNSIYGELDTNK